MTAQPKVPQISANGQRKRTNRPLDDWDLVSFNRVGAARWG